jgi:peroxiredoxin
MTWKTFAAEVGEQPAPGFALPSRHGRVVRREDYRQRRALLLYFAHGVDCAACRTGLRLLSEYCVAVREQEAEVLALQPADGASAMPETAFPLLTDDAGGAATAYEAALGQRGPMLVVLDRFGAPRASFAGHLTEEVLDEALRWLELMSYECPE